MTLPPPPQPPPPPPSPPAQATDAERRQRDRLEDLLVSRTVQLAEASERAESAGRAKRTFLAHASHEIRTPLNVIIGLAHLMQGAEADPVQRGRAQTIEQTARQLSQIIDDVLDLARAEGEVQAPPGPAWVAEPAATVRPGAATAALLRQRHPGRRVLLAEDDGVNQLVMLELLSECGFEVDTANDGRAAVEMAACRPYALILLDLRMPRLDGVAAARAIRALPGLQGTPLLAISANAFAEERQACREAGMSDFLAKPVDVPRLFEMLLRWLDTAPQAPSQLQPQAPSQLQPQAPSQLQPQSLPAGPTLAQPPVAIAGAAAVTTPAMINLASPPAQPGADLLAPLRGLEGVDADGGLASVGGKPAVYRRLLQAFIDTHDGDGEQLLQLSQPPAAGNPAAAGALAHRLRGSSATLGLIDVETAAAALELALDTGIEDAPLLPLARRVDVALGATLQRLREALAS